MTHKFEEREHIVLHNEGQKIFGIVHWPLTPGPWPAVLICHGMGGQKTGKYRIYVSLAERLVKQGIAVLRLDFRGSGDSEGSFQEMTLESEVSDALEGLKYLSQQKKIDPERIGIFGRSLGGVVAVITARRFAKIKSLAVWAPLFNGDQWQENWGLVKSNNITPELRDVLMSINGQLAGYPFFEQLFDLKLEQEFEDLHHVPFLHMHGEKDETISLTHAEMYEKVRQRSKAKNKFIRLPLSDHDFSHPKEQQFALDETTEWFKNTL